MAPASHCRSDITVPRCPGSPSRWFLFGAALAMFAVVVQTMLPFVLAADIAAAANPASICHFPPGDPQKSHQPSPANACPICAALAATIAAPETTAPPIPLPQIVFARPTVARHEKAADIFLPCPYRSRAPPAA